MLDRFADGDYRVIRGAIISDGLDAVSHV